MDTVNLGRHKFFQPLEHLTLLERVAKQYVDGQLQIFSISQQWSIYFEEGKIVYACQLHEMWDIFYKKLQNLNPQVSSITKDTYRQLKAIFDSNLDSEVTSDSDYLAICWLVNQRYLTPSQAAQLIKELVAEVTDSFLKLRDGIYEFTINSSLNDLPKFCHIDISAIASRFQQYSFKSSGVNNSLSATKQYSKSSLNQQDFANYEQQYIAPEKNSVVNGNNNVVNLQTYDTKAGDGGGTNKLYKIMCIDDSPTILKAIKGFLDDELFEVIGVEDSLKALMHILRTKPDIILLDISMPNLDGYELCSLLRKHPDFRHTPVVMVTGRSGFIDKARAKLVKASGYLTKPFSKAELLKTVFQQVGYLN